jgi:Cadherin-like beta sandwich domain
LVPAFSASVLNYTVTVASGVTSVNVSATKSDPNAVMSGSVTAGAGVATGQATISLNGPGNSTPITIVVEAPNGNEKTYTVIVNRAALGGNNNLQTLTVTSGSLVPAFIASTTSYTVAVASGVDSVTVAATAQDAGATVSINNQTTTSLLVPLGAAGSSTPISIEVTAPNGNPKTYTVTVNRAAIVLSENNNLSALDVSAGALIETFDAGTTSYTVTAPNTTTDTTVTATVADPTATLTINGSAATSGVPSASIALAVGPNSIPIVVTAENLSTKTYTVTITREP